MRSFIYEGIEHRLSERNWKKLLRRFDDNNAKLNCLGYFSVHVGSICEHRNYKCRRCPLRDPHKKTNSCSYLFRRIIGEELYSYIHLFDSTIIWEPRFDAEARQALQKVKDTLSTAKRIN